MTELSLASLDALGTPEIVEQINYESLLTARKQAFLSRAAALGLDFDATDLETEPVAAVLQEGAYEEIVLRARGNDIALARYLKFAIGAEVDHLGAFYDCIRITGESDDRFKERIILAIRGRSTGGTEPRYRGIALGASLRVDDAKVYVVSPSPVVNVAVFSTDNNGVPDSGLLATVAAALNADDAKMINDTISVRAAVQVIQNVTASVYLHPGASDSLAATIAAGLAAEWAAVGFIGRDLTLSWLTGAIMKEGVHSVSISSPAADVVVDPYIAVRLGTVTISVAGRKF